MPRPSADDDLAAAAASLVGEVAVLQPRYRLQQLPGSRAPMEEEGDQPL
jgi:hypothetical protein